MTFDDADKKQRLDSAAERVIDLADKIFSNHGSSEDIAELETLLLATPELRKIYLRYVMIHSQLAVSTSGLSGDVLIANKTKAPTSIDKKTTLGRLLAIASAIAAAILISGWVYVVNCNNTRPGQESNFADASGNEYPIAKHYDRRNLPTQIVGVLVSEKSRNISSSTLNVDQGEAELKTTDGIDLQIEGPAKFGASSSSAGVLFHGSVLANLTRPNTKYSIETTGLRVIDRGTEFRVAKMDQNQVRVEVLDGEVEVQSRIRKPLFLWSFDDFPSNSGDKPAVDSGIVSHRVERVPGIVGSGALSFENRNDSLVQINAGAGKEVGTGAMACSSGISIEAIVISRWDGGKINYDEIFRKEDGNHRMLLSFQNDGSPFGYETPQVASGPCLSFGLHLNQYGYSELDMPLDGKEGRPTLQEITDGTPHHIVATYDSFTGRKSIFIDGRIRMSHDFAEGTLLLNGGPALAEIGNHGSFEPFTGIIDEVAYYDFALTDEEIALHYERAMRGLPYYEQPYGASTSDRWKAITIVRAGSTQVFDLSSHVLPIENLDSAPNEEK